MDEQPEALWLADFYANKCTILPEWLCNDTAAELRRLHEVNAELMEALRYLKALVTESTLRQMADDAVAKATGEQQ